MNTLLIIRPEIFSIIVMLFLIGYDRYCDKFRSEKNIFFKFALMCLGHCVLALVTEITVNMDGISVALNDFLHILFFLFSLLYSLFFLGYALSLILPEGRLRRGIMIAGNVLCMVSVIVMILSPIDYIQGNGTRYSAGIGPTVCYMLGFLFFITADVVIIINRARIKKSVLVTIIPLSFITLGLLIVQIIVPEFLFTAQALTITAVGLFFALENPVEKFKTQAFIDFNAQVWNRNCYEYDLEHGIADKLGRGIEMTYIMGDINGLKTVNDRLGHGQGDQLIIKTAENLRKCMASAYKIYRTGGDEFVIICFGRPIEMIESEIEAASSSCNQIRLGENIPVGISIGYAVMAAGETIADAAERAEKMMYEKKREYYSNSGLNRRAR